jgi:hypothetical protein
MKLTYDSPEQYDDIQQLYEEYGNGLSFEEWAGCCVWDEMTLYNVKLQKRRPD